MRSITCNFCKSWLQGTLPPSEQDERMALMCHYDFWQQSGPKAGFATLAQSLKRLEHPELRVELADLLALLINRVQHEQLAMPHLPGNPLQLHARYAREQILVGFGATRFAQQPSAREGVFVITEQNIELLFVALNKTEKHFSPPRATTITPSASRFSIGRVKTALAPIVARV